MSSSTEIKQMPSVKSIQFTLAFCTSWTLTLENPVEFSKGSVVSLTWLYGFSINIIRKSWNCIKGTDSRSKVYFLVIKPEKDEELNTLRMAFTV